MKITPFRVLIVDDNPEFVRSLKSLILDVAGLQVDEILSVFNAHDGLELMRDHDFDFVFMDINMPSIDGIEATRFAKFAYEKPDMKIIGISFNSGFQYKSQMMQAGADNFLTKDEIDADRLIEIFNIYTKDSTL
jgi:CheY-like chemotaxis protein